MKRKIESVPLGGTITSTYNIWKKVSPLWCKRNCSNTFHQVVLGWVFFLGL